MAHKKKKNSSKAGILVSIVIPTLNEEKFIKTAIQPLLKQTIPRNKYEIIVSDSSSTDKTVAIAKKLADKVVVVKKISCGHGRNGGARVAKGKYLGFVDADTVVTKRWVEGLIEGLEKGILCTGPIRALEKDSPKLRAFVRLWSAMSRSSIAVRYPLIAGLSMGVHKAYFKKVGGFKKTGTVEDFDLSLKIAKYGKAVYSPKMIAYSSTRRLKRTKLHAYVWNGANFVLTGRSVDWKQHRINFSASQEKK